MSARDEDEQFGTAVDYTRALQAIVAEGIPHRHTALLQAHFDSPQHTATARQLAERVGYASYRGVNLQYGTLAHRIGERLGLAEPPRGFWLFVLADWAAERDVSGDTAFVLRQPLIEALLRLGFVRGYANEHARTENMLGIGQGAGLDARAQLLKRCSIVPGIRERQPPGRRTSARSARGVGGDSAAVRLCREGN